MKSTLTTWGGTLLVLAALGCLGGCRAQKPVATHVPVEFRLSASVAGRATLAHDVETRSLLVAFLRRDADDVNVYVQRVDAAGDPVGEPTRVNDLPGDAAAHPQAPPQIAIGPDGTVYLAWITQTPVPGRRFPASDLRFARSSDGARTFSPAITVHDDPGFPTSHHFHNMAVGPDGMVYVAWLDGTERDRARRNAHSASPTDAAVSNGHLHHTATDEDGTELRIARSADGGRTFEPPVVVARGTCQCCRTGLAVDSDGRVHIAWRHLYDDSIRDIAVASSVNDGQTFSPPQRIHADAWQIEGCPHTGPAVMSDDAGRLHVAWYSGAPASTGVWYAVRERGAEAFSLPVAVQRDLPVAQVSLAAMPDGPILVWEDPLARRVHARRMDGYTGADYVTSGLLPSAVGSVAGWALVTSSEDTIQLLAWTD